MKKMALLIFVIFVSALMLMSGCSRNDTDVSVNTNQSQGDPGNNSSDPAAGQQNENQQNSSEQPHGFSDFKGPGAEFKGGNAVMDYSLFVVRRVNHPEFVRLVFEFMGKVDDTVESPPEYTVRMENEKKISMRFKGVVKEEVMEYKSDILSLSELIEDVTFTRETNGEALVTLSFKRSVVFQVFDLAKPARVVLVFRQDMGQMNKM